MEELEENGLGSGVAEETHSSLARCDAYGRAYSEGYRKEEGGDAQSVRPKRRVRVHTGSDAVQTGSERLVYAFFRRAWWSCWLT